MFHVCHLEGSEHCVDVISYSKGIASQLWIRGIRSRRPGAGRTCSTFSKILTARVEDLEMTVHRRLSVSRFYAPTPDY